MSTTTASDQTILEDALAQLTQHIAVAQHTSVEHLTGRGVGPLAAPEGAPGTTDLNDILNNVVEVPGTTSVATVPTQPDPTLYQMLGQIQTLDSYISVLTAYCIYNEHPAPFDITDPKQAAAFAKATAKWRNYCITGGAVKALAAYLPVGQIVTQNFHKSVTAVDLHLEFLKELFGGFGLPAAALTQLDSILTKVVAGLADAKLSFENQSDTVDHFLTYYYFSPVDGTGEGTSIPAMFKASVRTFYLHIDQRSWKAAVGGKGSSASVSKFDFSMSYYDMTTAMNSGLVANDMTAINSAIQKLCGKTDKEINTLMNMQAINADPKKA